MKNYLCLLILFCAKTLYPRAPGEEVLPFGNFALPTSQRPGALLGIGQSFVDAHDLVLEGLVSLRRGCINSSNEIIPGVLYGVSERLYATLFTPVAFKLSRENCCSHGLEDIGLQLEYLAYESGNKTVSNYMSLVGIVTLPTGSSDKIPATGAGVPTCLLGVTAGSLMIDWYLFASSGYLMHPERRQTKQGNLFLYQGGIGRNLGAVSEKWLLTAIIEFSGFYAQHDKLCGMHVNTSGSNKGFLATSLWFATQQLGVQFGIAWPVYQQYNGIKMCNRDDRYWIIAFLEWKF